MKILRLRLTNVGPFYGHYDFNLNTPKTSANVVLFGGQNGSGKTTILESLKLGLFGPLAFGYKTETPGYFEKVEAKFNALAKARGESSFRIMVDVEMTEHFEVIHYTLNRYWTVGKKGSIREDLLIHRNSQPLGERENVILQEILRENYPPDLFELCLFDGEQSARVLSDDTLSTHLQNAVRVIFNFDLFENMESDLTQLIKQENILKDLDKDERLLQEWLENKQRLDLTLTELIRNLAKTDTSIEEKKSVLSQLNKQYDAYGGLLKDKRADLVRTMEDIENTRRLMMEETKAFVSTVMPFVLVKDLLNEVRDQLEIEDTYQTQQKLKTLLTEELMTKHLSRVLGKQATVGHDINKLATDIVNGIISDVQCDTKIEVFHSASYLQRAEIETMQHLVNDYDTNTIIGNFKENAKQIKKVQSLRSQIINSDSSEEIRTLLDSIHKLESEVVSLEHTRVTHEMHIEEQKTQLGTMEIEIEQLKKRIIDIRKTKNVFAIANKIKDISVAFRKKQLVKRLHQVEQHLVHMLQLLYRKDLFIVRVEIDPVSFELRLFGPHSQEINKDILSAAEKQLLLLSVVWAMTIASNRRLPFVFDTLLGRLDQSHKKSVIQHLIPKCGNQVIILATDSEVDQEHYNLIRPLTEKVFTIDFDSAQSKVCVKEDVFFDYAI